MIRSILAVTLAGATALAAPAARHDPGPDAEIARELRGLTPGPAQTCINPLTTGEARHSGNTYLTMGQNGVRYVAQFEGGCRVSSVDALVIRRYGSQLCRGDVAEVRDLTANIPRGSCIFSDFVPYRRADRMQH